jgi:hypothetical protein
MGAPEPKVRSISDIKHLIMQPALTSHYECHFSIPPDVQKFSSFSFNTSGDKKPGSREFTDLLTLSCSDASLPGSTLATHELNNDITGVTQRHAYRRLYDDRADFTFYVDQNYTQIRFFEAWMRFISGEQENKKISGDLERPYRVRYPIKYKTSIYITKFERDIGIPNITGKNSEETRDNSKSKKIVYTFFNAFPISVGSMPISYESSQLLKVNVSFTYDRYVAGNASINASSSQPGQTTASGVPKSPFDLTQQQLSEINYNAFNQNQNLNLGNYSPGTFTNTNLSGVFDSSDPTRVFQRSELTELNSQIYSGNTRLF